MSEIQELKKLSQNFRVLYVEDDLSIKQSMDSYLAKFFLEVVSANNGKEGLEAFKNGSFDLVITDLSMPVMNGIEMISKIKEINKDQAVLVTSAHSESEYTVSAIEAGIDGYIIKPFNFTQLNAEIYKIVQRLSIYKENNEYKENLEKLVDSKTKMLSSLLSFQHDNYEKTIYSMVEMIEDRDTYTAGHSKRVAQYSKLIAQQMGCSEEDTTMLYQAGVLHDVGKIATPDAVLLNPKSLNEIEYKLIQEHVNVGYKLIRNVPMFEPLSEIILSHHERYDGEGYPRGLEGNDITPLARIMIVADAFDAMTTNRIYKARKSVVEALSEIKELSMKQFHPEVVDAALIALKDIVLEDSINQLPSTHLEEERFAYFYKDILTDVYNKNYLDLLLIKNQFEKNYSYMDAFFLNNFSTYNKENSWSEGDKILKTLASAFKEFYKDSLVFRVFGDDFIILSKEQITIDPLKAKIDSIIKGSTLAYQYQSLDISNIDIASSEEIVNLFS